MGRKAKKPKKDAPRERIKANLLYFLLNHDKTYGDAWRGPYSYQIPLEVEIIYRALTGKGGIITALYPRQSGKSDALAMALFYLITLSAVGATPRPIKVGIFAPSEPQALLLARKIKTKIMRIEGDLKRYGVMPIKDLESWLEYPNGTPLKAISASKTAQIVGESFNIMILDESQDILDEVKENRIDPMGAAYDALKVYIGTPGYTPNFFYRALQDDRNTHFITTLEDAIRENPFYERYIEVQKAELGENSPAFRRQYALEWLFNIGQPITYKDMLALQKRGLDKVLSYSEAPAYVGLDLAKYDDSTVATVIIDKDGEPQIAAWLELRGMGYEAQLTELLAFFRNFPFIQNVVVDATGAGDPVLEWFKSARPDLPLEPFKFSAPAKDALYKEYLRAIEDRRLGIPKKGSNGRPTPQAAATEAEALKRFIDQNLTLQREVKNGLMLLHHPPGGHDDYPDSAALALWAFLKRPPRPTAKIVKTKRSKDSLGAWDKYQI